jgi:hypothetical protein
MWAEFMLMMLLHRLSAMPWDFDVGAIVGVGASTVVGYIRNFGRKRVVRIGVCLAAGVVAIEGGIDGNIQEIHLFGDEGLVCLGTLA